MARKTVVCLAVLTFLFVNVALKDIPDFIHVCHWNDPKLEECFATSAMAMIPQLKTGLPDYSIPSLEPLCIDELIASESTAGLKVTANKIKAFGASNFDITNMQIDKGKQLYVGDILLPLLYIEAEYVIDGKILMIPIRGNGPMKGNFTNCRAHITLQGELADVSGQTYLQFKSMTLKIKIEKGNILLENLFNGEKTLGEVVNAAINSNFDGFVKELLPLIEKSLAKVFLQTAQNIVKVFTFDQLFPKD